MYNIIKINIEQVIKMVLHYIDEGIGLRPFKESDAEEFYTLTINSKENLKKWLGWLDNIHSAEDTLKHIQFRILEIEKNDGTPLNFAITYKRKIIGTIGFNSIDKTNKIGTIGYWLSEDYQGKGIMTKAFKRIVDYGFKELSLQHIEVRVAKENYKSRALPERFSFKTEGVIKEAEWLYDHSVDHVLYSIS